MATMMPCPTCKAKISTDASTCPKCGQPITPEDRLAAAGKAEAARKRAGFGCLTIIVVIGLLIALGSMGKQETTHKPSAGQIVLQIEREARAATDKASPALAPFKDVSSIKTHQEMARLCKAAAEACTNAVVELRRISIPPGLDRGVEDRLRSFLTVLADAYEKKVALYNGLAGFAQTKTRPTEETTSLGSKSTNFITFAWAELEAAKQLAGLPSALDKKEGKQ